MDEPISFPIISFGLIQSSKTTAYDLAPFSMRPNTQYSVPKEVTDPDWHRIVSHLDFAIWILYQNLRSVRVSLTPIIPSVQSSFFCLPLAFKTSEVCFSRRSLLVSPEIGADGRDIIDKLCVTFGDLRPPMWWTSKRPPGHNQSSWNLIEFGPTTAKCPGYRLADSFLSFFALAIILLIWVCMHLEGLLAWKKKGIFLP
jgi:hypothetical protein